MNAPPVRYVTTSDGFNIAYSQMGAGSPWVIVPPGFHHLHATLEVASMRAWIDGLAQRFQLVRYDSRGQGLSTRLLAQRPVMADFAIDLETVLDKVSVGPVVLHGIGSSAHTAVHFAARHPDRARALVLVHCSVTSAPWPSALMDILAKGRLGGVP